MAASRSRRDHAGAKMSGLLDKEEEDDFYKTTYGGFDDVGDDKDFNYHSPNEDEDQVDSDFSIDENDEVKSDPEDEEAAKKKVKRGDGVQTKAYKEPKRNDVPKPKPSSSKPKAKTTLKLSQKEYGRRLGTRTSTANKTSETIKIIRRREAESKRKRLKLKKKQKVEVKMTQEEILKEAKVTEKMNLESLKKYQEMELENKRKAIRSGTRVVKGPAIRFQSLTMPLIEEIKKEEVDVKMEVGEDECDEREVSKGKGKQHQSRTFVSFSDDATLKENFPKSNRRLPAPKICPVTRLPAKYFDPVTELPYANLQAFKIIREAYYQQLETRGDKTDPEISSWLSWREKNKPAKPILVSVNRPPAAFTANLAAAQQRQTASGVKSNNAAGAGAQVTSSGVVSALMGTKQQIMLPTRPIPIPSTQTPAANSAVQAVKLPTSPAQGISVARTIGTTTLSAVQLQQLAAARGQVFVSGLQTQVRPGQAQVTVTGSGASPAQAAGAVRQVTAQLARGGQIVRQGGQTSLIVSQQPRQALAVQRPLLSGQAVGVVARSVTRPQGAGQQIMMATSPGGVRAAGPQIMVQGNLGRAVPGQLVMASSGQLRQTPGGVMVVATSGQATPGGGVIVQSSASAVTSGATRQHYVISNNQAGIMAQLQGQTGQTVRPGQIVQVAGGQQGQHQIVVSSSGQIVLQPPTSKQM